MHNPKTTESQCEHTVPEAWAAGSAGWPGQSVAEPGTECCCVGSPDCLPQLLQHLQQHLARLLHHLQPVPAATWCCTSCIPPPTLHAFPVDLSGLHRHVHVVQPEHADEQHQSNAMLAQVSVQAEYSCHGNHIQVLVEPSTASVSRTHASQADTCGLNMSRGCVLGPAGAAGC